MLISSAVALSIGLFAQTIPPNIEVGSVLYAFTSVSYTHLLSCQKFHNGVRIEMLCGKRAMEYLNTVNKENNTISTLLSAKIGETSKAVERLLNENQSLKSKIVEIENQILNDIASE